ncbi:MAG: hypothetical protein A2511_00265 [Deltaproteobacteria bacterium RIFOXYD12_FULL_50_9]|nr:MAG: hypothetical protein A2511_00265 [Deltaproteobacteria bacterium RIFOXYD12_FULL_50_9]
MLTNLRLSFVLVLLMISSMTISNLGITAAYAALGESGTVVGVVAEKSPGSFFLSHDGEKTRFLTGRETSFDPSDYRPQAGDTVSVTFSSKTMRSGTVELVANLIKLNAVNPDRKEIKSPADGQIAEVGKKMIKITFPAENMTMGFDRKRSTEFVPADWKPEAGNNVTVSFTKVPSRFGNGYVYEIDKLEKK